MKFCNSYTSVPVLQFCLPPPLIIASCVIISFDSESSRNKLKRLETPFHSNHYTKMHHKLKQHHGGSLSGQAIFSGKF